MCPESAGLDSLGAQRAIRGSVTRTAIVKVELYGHPPRPRLKNAFSPP
jgi:hypothetical protein